MRCGVCIKSVARCHLRTELDLPYWTRDTGIGLGLSNVGDGNTQISVMQSFGARIADDAGKTAAIKSDATKAYLTRVKNAWGQGPLPPGNTTWDVAGDNIDFDGVLRPDMFRPSRATATRTQAIRPSAGSTRSATFAGCARPSMRDRTNP